MPETLITHINSTTVNNTPAGAGGITASLTSSLPSGTLNGHVMLASVYFPGGDVLATPSGWTAVNTVLTDATNNIRTQVFWKVAASEPSTSTWSITNAGSADTNTWGVAISTFSGVDTTSPIHASAASTDLGTASTTSTGPNVTTTIFTNIFTFEGIRSSNTTEKTLSSSGDTALVSNWGLNGGVTDRNGVIAFRTTKSANGTVSPSSMTINSTSGVISRGNWTVALTPGPPVDSDSGTGTESESGTVTAPDSDSGTGTETESISIPIADSDTGTGSEAENVLQVTEYIVSDNFDRPNESPLGISSSGHTWTNV